MEDVADQQTEPRPEHIVRLWQTRHGLGAESRAGFAAHVLEVVGYVAPGQLQAIWDQGADELKGETT